MLILVIVCVVLRGPTLREHQLELEQGRAMRRVQEPKGAYAMKSLGRHVLQKAPQKLLRGQAHALALMVAAVAVRDADCAIVAADDRFVAERGAMHVATEV